MTSISTIHNSLAPQLESLNRQIEQALTSPNELMNMVIRSYLEKKGKQIRPIIVLLTAQLLGGINNKVISGAVAVELLHNASLIHDDVVDDTTMRRGAQTINGAYDNHMAVLIGDFFLSNALLQSVATGDIRVVESISNLGKLLSVGELDEISNSKANTFDEDKYFEIIYRKTASLFVSCVEVGAYGAGLSEGDDLDALREFARLLGLCFQIKDDIFDYFSDEAIGKPTGNDLREGKITLPLLHVLNRADLPRQPEMARLACSESHTPAEIATLIAYAVDNGGIDYANACMARLRAQAARLLDRFPDSQARRNLLAIFDFIIDRKN